MRLKALTLGNVLNTHIIGVECLENFLQTHEGREANFFDWVGRNPENFRMSKKLKKVDFGGQNDLKTNFFLSASEVSGT